MILTFFSLAYFILTIRYITYITYKLCVNWLFMLLVRLPVNSRQSVVKFWGSPKLYAYFWLQGISNCNPCYSRVNYSSSKVSCFIWWHQYKRSGKGNKFLLPLPDHHFKNINSSYILLYQYTLIRLQAHVKVSVYSHSCERLFKSLVHSYKIMCLWDSVFFIADANLSSVQC